MSEASGLRGLTADVGFGFLNRTILKPIRKPMPTFEARPLGPKTRTSSINATLRKHPALFGVPFLFIIVGASFGLKRLTETRYEARNERVTQACFINDISPNCRV